MSFIAPTIWTRAFQMDFELPLHHRLASRPVRTTEQNLFIWQQSSTVSKRSTTTIPLIPIERLSIKQIFSMGHEDVPIVLKQEAGASRVYSWLRFVWKGNHLSTVILNYWQMMRPWGLLSIPGRLHLALVWLKVSFQGWLFFHYPKDNLKSSL